MPLVKLNRIVSLNDWTVFYRTLFIIAIVPDYLISLLKSAGFR